MAGVPVVISIISAATSVVSLAMSLSMKPDDPKDNGTAIDRKGQDNPKVIPFGRCLVPSVRVFNNVHNTETERLIQVHSFGVGKIKSFEQIYIDGVPVFAEGIQAPVNTWLSGNFSGSSGEFPNLSFGLRLGEKTEEAYPHIIKYSDNQWDTGCRGDRTPSMSLEVYRKINEDGDNNIRLISDRFKVEALIHGNAVIDPRFDTEFQGVSDWTKRTWQNDSRVSYRNPACVILTYLLDSYFGLGLSVDAVDIKSFIDLANYCDEKGLTFDGYIDQGSDFGEILVGMATSFDGVLYVEDGVVKAKADKVSPAVAHITQDSLVGTFKLSNASDSSYYNVVSAEFINEETTFTKDKYVLPANLSESQTIEEDGFEKTKEIKFPYTISSPSKGKSLIKALTNKALKKSKLQRTVEFSLDNSEISVNIFDVIEITQPDYGLNRAKFRVDKVVSTLDENTMVSTVTATEYSDTVYDDSDFEDGVTSPPIKPPTFSIPAPTNLEFSQIGTGKGVLSWDNRHYKEHRVQVVHNGNLVASISGSKYIFENLKAGTHSFKLRAVDSLGATSDWVELLNQTVTPGVPLPDVTGLKCEFTSPEALISWDDMKGAVVGVNGDLTVQDVFSHYEVILSENGAYKETLEILQNFCTYKPSHRVLKVEVRVVDKEGNRSQKGAVVNVKNPQCVQPSGVEVKAVLDTITVSWDSPKESDYLSTDVHVSNTSGFIPSESSRVQTTNTNVYTLLGDFEGEHFVRIGHYDVFGSDSIAYSAPISFTKKTIDDFLDSSNSWTEITNEVDSVNNRVTEAVSDIVQNAEDIITVNSTLGSQQSQINSNKTLITGVSGNLANLEQSVSAELGDVKSAIDSNKTAIAGVDASLTEYKSSVSAEFSGVKSSIQSNQTAIANANEAITSLDTKLSSEIDGVQASLAQNYYTKTQTDGKVSTAIAASESKLNAEIDKNKASISTLNQVTANTDGKVEALTQIKHDVNGKISGLIMGNDGETSTFDVIADKFRISSKAGSQAVFQVNSTTGQTVIQDALIGSLSASKITSGVMDANRISASSTLSVGAGNNIARLSGTDSTWRLSVGHSTMGSAPFRVNQAGKLFATNADITGHINATSGTFNGHVIAQSIELPAGTIPDTYDGQSQTQIWGGGYNVDKSRGWGIHSNGYAEFLGGLNTKNATIEGAMIIGATIYSGESLYSIDFNTDGLTDDLRYINHPEIPLGARPSYSANTNVSLLGYRDWMTTSGTFNVTSCTERRGDPNSSRFRWGKIRAGAMSVSSTAGYITQLTTIWGGTVGAKFTITLYAPDGSVVERSPVKTISRALSGYYNGTDTAIVTVAGVSFDVSFRYKMDVERDHDHKPTGAYWAELGGFSVSNKAGTFGSLTDNAKNGYFGVEVQCGLISGKSNGWTGNNRGVAYQLTVNNSDLPA
ncbi:phage tail protein [Vibrio vulnificus]|nr:phage tail protein [Vibrio vulnificus]